MNEFGLTPITEQSTAEITSQQPNTFGLTPLTPEEEPLSTTEAWKGRGEAALRGLISRPGAVLVQKALGITPEESALREQKLGGEALAYEFGAMALPAALTLGSSLAAKAGLTGLAGAAAKVATLGEFTQAGLLTKAGQAAVKKLGVKGVAAAPAVAMGVENALFAAADETAKALENNPNTVAQSVYNVGLSGMLGGVFGAGIGKAGDLWKTTYGPKYKSFLSDFSGRVKDHARGELPAADVVATELQTVFNTADELKYKLSSSRGLKRQEIESLLPKEATEAMIEASNDVLRKTDNILKKAAEKPANFGGAKINKIEEHALELAGKLSDPSISAYDRFIALDSFKQQVGKQTRFDIAQEGASQLAKDLYRDVMVNLENTSAWGLAGQRQAEINKAVSKWRQSFKASRNYFANKVQGTVDEYVINPDKLNTLINQAKKGKAEIKQTAISDFLDATEELFNTVENVNTRLGLKIDYDRPAMTAAKAVTQKLTPGMKAADFIYQEALNTTATGAGGFIGYKAGKALGIPGGEWLGALFGGQALEPLIKKVLPVLIKPISGPGITTGSVRAAGQVIGAVASGENLSRLAADSLWLKDKPVKDNKKSDPKHLERLDKQIQDLQRNPQSLIEMNDDLTEALPKQGTALSTTAMNAMAYLIEKRPFPKQNMPLDKIVEPSKAEMTEYYRTLEIAENPLVIIKKIKDGSLKSKDLIDFSSMYPALYDDLSQKILLSYANHLNKGGKIDYKIKKSLSLFGMQALTSDLTPQAIQAAQSTYAPKNLPAGQTPQFAPKSSRKSQLPGLTETEQQRRIRQ